MATVYYDRYGNWQGEIPSLLGEIIPYIVVDVGFFPL